MTQVHTAQVTTAAGPAVHVQVAPRGLQGMRLTRRGWVVMALLGLVLATVITLLGVRAGADGSPQAVEVGRHAVQTGETVWSLAVGLNTGQDVRDLVDEIMDLNGRNSPVLYAGEVILLPRY